MTHGVISRKCAFLLHGTHALTISFLAWGNSTCFLQPMQGESLCTGKVVKLVVQIWRKRTAYFFWSPGLRLSIVTQKLVINFTLHMTSYAIYRQSMMAPHVGTCTYCTHDIWCRCGFCAVYFHGNIRINYFVGILPSCCCCCCCCRSCFLWLWKVQPTYLHITLQLCTCYATLHKRSHISRPLPLVLCLGGRRPS